jgi:putative hydrolase of the HAD superfamily
MGGQRITPKAVFFDLDDTLCDYRGAVELALQATVEFLVGKYPHLQPEAIESEYMAIYNRDVKAYWTSRWLLKGPRYGARVIYQLLHAAKIDDRETAAQAARIYEETNYANLRLFDESEGVLRALKGKLPLGLLTNGPGDVQRKELSVLGIAGYFDHIFVAGEVGVSKPETVMFEKAARAVGAEPGEIAFVGDSQTRDLIGGKKAGFIVVWVNRRRETLDKGVPKPDFEIPNLVGLLRMVDLDTPGEGG